MELKEINEHEAFYTINECSYRLHGLASLLAHMLDLKAQSKNKTSYIEMGTDELNFITMTIDRMSEELAEAYVLLLKERSKRKDADKMGYSLKE